MKKEKICVDEFYTVTKSKGVILSPALRSKVEDFIKTSIDKYNGVPHTIKKRNRIVNDILNHTKDKDKNTVQQVINDFSSEEFHNTCPEHIL